jgi:hypothetical protein
MICWLKKPSIRSRIMQWIHSMDLLPVFPKNNYASPSVHVTQGTPCLLHLCGSFSLWCVLLRVTSLDHGGIFTDRMMATVLIPLFWNLNMVPHVSALRLTSKFWCVYLQDCQLVCQFAMDHWLLHVMITHFCLCITLDINPFQAWSTNKFSIMEPCPLLNQALTMTLWMSSTWNGYGKTLLA